VTQSALLYGVAAAGANVLGAVAVATRTKWSVRALDSMLSFAAGFLISVSLVDSVMLQVRDVVVCRGAHENGELLWRFLQ